MRLPQPIFVTVLNGDHIYYNPWSSTYEIRRHTSQGLFIVTPCSWERCASDLALSSLLKEMQDEYYSNPVATF